MKIFSFIAAFAFAFTLINCSSTSKNSGRGLAQATDGFSEPEEWAEMQQIANTLDFAGPGIIVRKPEQGGSSVYVQINRDGKSIGGVLPENGATVLSGEIMAYTLARALGVSHIYQPGIYFKLTGNNYEIFKQVQPRQSPPNEHQMKRDNRAKVWAEIDRNPNYLDTIFKKWDHKATGYDAIAVNSVFRADHVLQGSSTSVGNLISCHGAQPSKDKQVKLNGGSNSEYEIARQLSTILLIDALHQQWDRFSGNNIQTINENGVVSLVSFDNGGAWGGNGWTTKNLGWVSRFDADVANRILALNAFMNENSGDFFGIKTMPELQAALGAQNFSGRMNQLKTTVKMVADHLKKNQGCYFQ